MDSERDILKEIALQEHILSIINSENIQPETFKTPDIYDYEGNKISDSMYGIIFPSKDYAHSRKIIYRLREKLLPEGYIPFLFDNDILNNGRKCKTALLKAKDIYEVISIMGTNGINSNTSNEDIIKKLKDWEKICSFDITGINTDWLYIEFKTLPEELLSFAEDLYQFCPETIENGYVWAPAGENDTMEDFEEPFERETAEELADYLEKNKYIFLWWD